jgi:ABC-type nitrate/sulfonate/bicarbonate transport system ATPase subunit
LVGLGDRLNHPPRRLSGGREQQVAVACAIATDPNLLLADELTGNLDAAAQEVLTIFAGLSPDFRKTIVAVTYDPHAASLASLRLHLETRMPGARIGERRPPGTVRCCEHARDPNGEPSISAGVRRPPTPAQVPDLSTRLSDGG